MELQTEERAEPPEPPEPAEPLFFCNKILKKLKIVIKKMSTRGLALKNNRERKKKEKKRKIKREKANKKDSVQQGVFFVGHPG